MTMRSFVSLGAMRDAAAEAVEVESATRSPADQKHRAVEPTAAEQRPASRCSPDPAMHTDRYRLVTPFSLRL